MPVWSLPCLCVFKQKGTAVLLAREPVAALESVGRLVYRLTICGHIFMVWNPKYALYNSMWERDDKVSQSSTAFPVSQWKVPAGVKARCFPSWCKILCWWMGRLVLRNGPRSPEQIDLCSNPSFTTCEFDELGRLFGLSDYKSINLTTALVWAPLRAESKIRAWVQVFSLADNPRKQEWGSEVIE